MKYILLPLLIFAFTSLVPANGQIQKNKILSNEVRLKPYILDNQVESVQDFIIREVQKNEVFDSKYFRLIRFAQILTKNQKINLQSLGIQIEYYIPYKSYLLSIPVDFPKNKLAEFQPIHVINLSIENKLSGPILDQISKPETDENLPIELLVQTYVSINVSTIETELKKFGKPEPYGTLKRTYFLKTDFKNIKKIANLPGIKYLEIAPGTPVPDDTKGRSLHRSNAINTDYYGGLKYDGKGVSISLADDGHIGPHIDFKGRLKSFTTSNTGTHGDMTSGICVGAANLDPRHKGMATGAFLNLYGINGYPQINQAIQNLANLKSVITSTSYSEGCNQYTTTSEDGDSKMYENSPLLFVFSGGNNGVGNCNYGAGAGWGNITGGYKNGKNVIAVGNLDQTGIIDPSSSRGPAPDGRIKPDISANGTDQMSTDEDYTYSVGGGTSAACPGLAGVSAQLYQAWRELKSEVNPDAALIKGILLNSADDLGRTGPDFVYGWGGVNARKALKTIQLSRYRMEAIDNGDTVNFALNVPSNTRNLKVMICWSDPAGTPNAGISLVNDLDLTVKQPNGQISFPWKLNSRPVASLLSLPAGTGRDSLNNAEQVSIDNPIGGTYNVSVRGSSVPQGTQIFYIIYQYEDNEVVLTYPTGGEGFVAGEGERIRWDAPKSVSNFNLSFSADSGATWTNIANITDGSNQYEWLVPNRVTGRALIRISSDSSSDVNDFPFGIIGVPGNLRIVNACIDSMNLAWNAVSGATKYEVSMLGQKYMDSVGTSFTTGLKVKYTLTDTIWFSVRAVFPNGNKGRRALAKQKFPGLQNCIIPNDVQVSRPILPLNGLNYNCSGLSSFKVKLMLRNRGNNALNNIPVSFKYNNNPTVSEIVLDTIDPGDSLEYTFVNTINIIGTSHKMIIKSQLPLDRNYSNDSLNYSFSMAGNPVSSLTQPFSSSVFPPPNWSVISADDPSNTWKRSVSIPGSIGITTNAARMDNFVFNANGSRDFLTAPLIDLSSVANAKLTFDRAYAPRFARRDSLIILVSSDCGLNYFPVGYAKGYAELATAPTRTTSFTPSGETQWKADTVDLSAYQGDKILIRFVSVSRFGNVLYVDNIKVGGITVSTNNLQSEKQLAIFPNPAESKISIQFPDGVSNEAAFKILGVDGRILREKVPIKPVDGQQNIDISGLPSGIYNLIVTDKDRVWQSRFSRK